MKPIPLGLFDRVAVPTIFFGNLESDFVSICKFFLDLQEIHKDKDSLWLLIRNWQGS